MTTAAIRKEYTRVQTSFGNIEMEERKEPTFVQFGVGEVVEGVFLGIEKIAIDQKPAIRYTVMQPDGELVSFLGTAQLNQKLRKADLAHYVVVRYEGDNAQAGRNGNAMKLFKVQVSKEDLPNAHGLLITDADIPDFGEGGK
jgi:hypothetical protein